MVSRKIKRSRKKQRRDRWTRSRVRGSRWKDGYLLAVVEGSNVDGRVLLEVV